MHYYYLKHSDYWPYLYCYNHNISANMSFSLLQVFHIELRSPHRMSNMAKWIMHLVGRCFSSEIIWRLQVQSQQQIRLTRNTYYNLTLVMVNRIGTVYPCDSNKEFSSRFCVDSQVWHETPEEGRRTYWPKRCDCNNKDEVNSPNILSNNNYLTSLQKFRQTIQCMFYKSNF